MTTPKTKIFVGHLPDGCRNEDLQQLFAKYGSVTECDVINKYGFVHMSTPEEAEKAIQSLNNYNLMGSNISVEPSKSKLHPQPGAPGRAKGSLASGKGRGGMSPRNGFGTRDGYGAPFPNGIRRYETSPFGGPMGDSYYDRPFGFGRDRMRPYPPPYERSIPSMVSPREEYARRTMSMAMQPPPVPSDPYGRPYSTVTREDLYERRAPTERPDYLPYSRRTPPPPPSSMSLTRSYWLDDLGAAGDFNSRAPPPAATRRTYY